MPGQTVPCVTCDAPLPVKAGQRVVRCPGCRTRTGVEAEGTPNRPHFPHMTAHLLAAVAVVVAVAVGIGAFLWVRLAGREDRADERTQASPTTPAESGRPPEPKPKPRPTPAPQPAPTEPTGDKPPVRAVPPIDPAPEVKWNTPKLDRAPIRQRPAWADANIADVRESLKKLEDADPVFTYPPIAPRPKKPVFPGYLKRTAFGFSLYVSEECHDQNDKRDGQPLGCLESELQSIVERLPEGVVKQLAKVPIWVEWDHAVPDHPDFIAVYHHSSSAAYMSLEGVDPRKERCVVVMTLRTIFLAKSRDKDPANILAHELAHAVHDQVLGSDNTVVRNAYEQALTKKLYSDVKHANGETGPAYALTNEAEYFAEMSACYLDRIRYEPSNAAGLREYDNAGYELMTKVWGTEKAIEKAKKADADRKAKLKK